jgi:[protein-PII] uridylyltransferase
LTIEWAKPAGRGLQCTIAAADRPGLLATVAGALALAGLDIESAVAYTHHDGMALEVLTGIDRFDRLSDAAGRDKASELLVGALAGELPLDDLLRERMRRYRAPANANVDRDVRILVDLDASAFTTVVEIHAPDEVGLLARIASVFADLAIDISVALVSTIGDRVIDVFYVRDADGNKLTDHLLLERLRATLLARLTTDVTLL